MIIKVIENNEWVMTFENQEQLDNFIQRMPVEYFNENDIEYIYEDND